MELFKLIKLKKLIFFYLLNLQALLRYIFIFFNKLMNMAPTSITKFFLFLKKKLFFFDPSFFYFYILSFFSFFPFNSCLFLHWFILLYFVLFYIYIFFFIFFFYFFFLLCIVKAIKPINPKKTFFFLKQLNLWLI